MNQIYLLVILIIILFIIKIYILNFELFINNVNKWLGYRLGDIVKYWNNEKYQKHSWEYINSIPNKYPNSIGHKYLKRNKVKKQNLTLLFKIIDEEIRNKQIPKSNISLHLRLGDVMSKNSKYQSYVTNIKDLENKIKMFKNKKINVFYGAHYEQKQKGLNNNEKYLEEVKKILQKYNIKYLIKSSGDPDFDFLSMCNSDIFIKSGGGYSNIISLYIKFKKKTVI